MIPLIVFVPLAIGGGGLLGLVHERLRGKRRMEQLSSKPTQDASRSGALEQNAPLTTRNDLVQIKHAGRAAHIALCMSAAGVFYPPLGLSALPFVGYSAFNWARARYPFEQKHRLKSPSTILAILALIGSLATGHWLLASLVLSADLAARKWVANWTIGYQVIGESGSDAQKLFAAISPSRLLSQRSNLARTSSQDGLAGERSSASLTLNSVGQLFAISDWHKLLTTAHWKRVLETMSDSFRVMWKKLHSM